LTGLYVVAVSFALGRIGLWSASNLKDTVLWTGGFAFVTLFELPQLHRNPAGFKRVIKQIVALTILLEFVANLYVMDLWLKLLLVPVVTVVTLLLGFAQARKEHAPLAGFLTVVQVVIELSILLYVGQSRVLASNGRASSRLPRRVDAE
jgi:hypothetical protein